MQPVDRREHPELHPAGRQLVVAVALEVTADVVAPPAVAGVGRGRGEVGLEVQGLPGDDRVAGEPDRVAVAADPGVAGERQRPLVLRRPRPESRKWKWLSSHSGSRPAILVTPPCCQSSHQKSTPSLLERVVQLLEVGLDEVRVGRVEAHRQLGVRVDAHPLRDRGVRRLVRVHTLGRVHVEGRRESALVQVGEELLRVREQLGVPGVAGPAAAVAGGRCRPGASPCRSRATDSGTPSARKRSTRSTYSSAV